MKKFAILILLFLVTISSCKTGEQTKIVKTIESNANYFSMFRGACYGQCPVYKIEIYKTGEFVYFGKSYVKNIGEHKGTLSKEQVTNFFELLNSYKWSSFLDEYPIDNVDFPGFTLEYGNATSRKKIRGNSNAPKELQELTKKVDALLKSVGY